MSAKVFLIPQFLSFESDVDSIPRSVVAAISSVRFFIVEEEKSARRFLRKLIPDFPLQACVFLRFSEHSSKKEIPEFWAQTEGQDVGIISEAGCPCVADPGAEIVLAAHHLGRTVVPLVGPSAILLALMASGLNGQNFAFNGYLPKERVDRIKKIRELERRAADGQTQIFMETPYRNQHLLEDVLSSCRPDTLLCLAVDLMGPNQFIKTLPVQAWRKESVALDKRPAIFLIQTLSANTR